jgi:hypothetical protein
MGGLVLETNMDEVIKTITEQKKVETTENPLESAKNDVKNFFGDFSRFVLALFVCLFIFYLFLFLFCFSSLSSSKIESDMFFISTFSFFFSK